MTVVLALCGLLIFPLSIFQTMGTGAILVVISAVLACLTLLPAMLGLLGDRVNALRIRIPFLKARKAASAAGTGGGFWAWTTRAVMRRPLLSLGVAGGLLVALTIPYFDLNKGMAGISTIPDGTRSKDGFVALEQAFGYGQDSPAVVVVDSAAGQEPVGQAVERLAAALQSDSAFVPLGLQPHPDANLYVYLARLAGDPMSKQSFDAVERLRDEYIPEAFAGVNARVLVGGYTASMVDFNTTTDTYTPIIFAFVLGLSFILLAVAFRSVVVPVTSIMMNLLSVGSAYGLLVLVFQKGVGASLLGFQRVDAIETWLPIFLFSVLFGLSMDYHVFLLSRMKEKYDETHKNIPAVSFGLQSTGRLITGAALIMVAVFGGFALGDMVMMQEMGFGLAAAVFVDATIVRSILVPATMRLLGRWNWYMPKWLSWIPRTGIGEGAAQGVPARASALLSSPSLVPAPETLPVRMD
jgi:RND superfamily putative drug exporter